MRSLPNSGDMMEKLFQALYEQQQLSALESLHKQMSSNAIGQQNEKCSNEAQSHPIKKEAEVAVNESSSNLPPLSSSESTQVAKSEQSNTFSGTELSNVGLKRVSPPLTAKRRLVFEPEAATEPQKKVSRLEGSATREVIETCKQEEHLRNHLSTGNLCSHALFLVLQLVF